LRATSLRIAALLLLVAAATGCVQSRMETVIGADGAGTMSLTYSVSPAVAEALKDIQGMPGQEAQSGEIPSLDDFDRAKLEAACAKHGVTLRKLDRAAVDGRETVALELAFASLEGLSAALSEAGTGQGGMKIWRTADGNYRLGSFSVEAPEAEAEADAPAEAPDMAQMDPAAMQKGMEAMGKLMAASSELNVVMKVTVPGDIVSHNAMRVEGRTAIWEINAQNMMTAGPALGEPEIVFSGQGLSLKADAE